jgi:hypothetical protein
MLKKHVKLLLKFEFVLFIIRKRFYTLKSFYLNAE